MKLRIIDMLNRVGSAGNATFARSAFTLLEALIAIAALGLLAVGLASIFDATGKTVTAGRRVSAFNAYASLIEQQLRTDIARMTRDGFLVIRNEYADRDGSGTITMPPSGQTAGVDSVFLYDGDERPRMRRIDELLFFAKGEFISARPTLHPSFVAKSDAARIYYGHGQRAMPPATFIAGDPYYQPEINGLPADPDTVLGFDDPDNPNRYASEWILLRQVVLLAPPRTSQVLPSGNVFNYAPNNPILEDSENQVFLQPAASHIFRGLLTFFPQTLSPNVIRQPLVRPVLYSGLVDIAATDLAMVRSIVTTASKYPNQVDRDFFNPQRNASPNEFQSNEGVDGVYTQFGTGSNDPDVIDRMRSWMLDAMPSPSLDPTANDYTRVRCELSPRNYLGSIDPTQVAYPLNSPEAAYRVADQVMLSASNFLPRCTEFIVEWSFGETWPSDPSSNNPPYNAQKAGELVWHGMNRFVGIEQVASPYVEDNDLHRHQTPYARVNGSTAFKLAQTELVHGFDENGLPPTGVSVENCFGFFDPTFDPDVDNDGKLESSNDSVSATIPWPWPKLIRVTLSLADPADPTIERTFQFIFQVPDGV